MQLISEEFRRVIADRLKLGERAKPVCRVEVDKLAYIPGYVEEIQSLVTEVETQKVIQRTWIEGDGKTILTPSGMAFPAVGYNLDAHVTSHFGKRDIGYHKGIDIGCPKGTDIVAVWDGVVSKTDSSELYTSWGKHVVINHGDGISTLYAHLNDIFVKVGDKVTLGQVIGKSGNTGRVFNSDVPVGGTYDDPNSPRSRGVGAHLHFEIHINGQEVDPYPYLFGESRLFSSSVNVGDIVDEGEVEVKLGNTVLMENFVVSNWYAKPQYVLGFNFPEVTKVVYRPGPASGGYLEVNFNTPSVTKTMFAINTNYQNPTLLEVSFASSIADGNFKIYVDDKLAVNVNDFEGLSRFQKVKDRYIPAGNHQIKFEIECRSGQPREFRIYYIKLVEVLEIPEFYQKGDLVSHKGYWYEREITEDLFFTRYDRTPLRTGKFVYMETLTLDNVISVDIDEQFEMEAAEARIVVSNPNGFYSPDYTPGLFPEANYISPFSYYANGAHVGVLSENTPIRIYMGYGLDTIRVFTGLIDKVDINGVEGTMTITARNMYKKIMEKVITEDKEYPEGLTTENILDVAPDTNFANLTREQQIVYKAQQYATAFGVDYKLILAIAKHETQMGTQGAGRASEGSYICGYGVPDSGNKKTWAAGIDRQCYYVAKRIREALGDRPTTAENVRYLWNGGDLGVAYRYATDTNWPNGVWNAYLSLPDYPAYFQQTASGMRYTNEEREEIESIGNVRWLKSAIVHDLVTHAGMVGWRVASDDVLYPDVVIEETYLIELHQNTGKVLKAVPGEEGRFEMVDASSIPTIHGWMNPFVEAGGRRFAAYSTKVGEAIRDVIQETNFRSYCDRYGTYRLERINFTKPIVGKFTEHDDFIGINKTIDFSRARSHLVIVDGEGKTKHFLDNEILMELKGEVRTARVSIPWATTDKQKEEVAKKMFWDMKRLCRTLQITIPGRPDLDLLDRIYIVDKATTTRGAYTIKGIRTTYSVTSGYMQVLDLFWADEGVVEWRAL